MITISPYSTPLLIIVFNFFHICSLLASMQQYEIRGALRCAAAVNNVPQLRVMFNGKETISNKEGFFAFPVDEKDLEKYALIICADVLQHFDKKNTLKNISIDPGQPYRYFTFKKNINQGLWIQKEKSLLKKRFIVPEHAVILLINPDYVESVTHWEIDLPSHVLKLPLIVLKDESIHRASACSLLHSLDKTVFCEPVRELRQREKNNPNILISRVQ